ncbi:MAG TPA: type IV-A pilus assembly ATPase PilB, partial [Cellvibrio sp.]
MNNPNPISLNGLARRLVADNLIDSDIAAKTMAQAKKEGVPFVDMLVGKEILDARTIARVAAEEFGSPVFDLTALNKDSIPLKLVDEKLIRKHHTLPIARRGNRLFLAVTDPTDIHALDEIKFNTGINTEAVLVEADKLKIAIEQYFNAQE